MNTPISPRPFPMFRVFALGGIALLGACGGAAPSAPASVPVAVRTELAFAPAGGTGGSAGFVEPRIQSLIAARIPGAIRAVRIEAGDSVRVGQVLLEIDAPGLAAAVGAAESARAQAHADLRRAEALAAEKAATPAQVDQARAAAAGAQARLAGAREALASARITAPHAGRVLERLVDPGSVVMPGQPLVRIAGAGGIRVSADADERLAAALKPGMKVGLSPADGEGFSGVIEKVFPAADPAARTVRVWINPQRDDLRPGSQLAIRWPGATPAPGHPAPAGARVSSAALMTRGGANFVFVHEAGRARLRLVRTGAAAGGMVEIISGLTAGETVILDPGALSDGLAVITEARS